MYEWYARNDSGLQLLVFVIQYFFFFLPYTDIPELDLCCDTHLRPITFVELCSKCPLDQICFRVMTCFSTFPLLLI